jgi:hypothetical protein
MKGKHEAVEVPADLANSIKCINLDLQVGVRVLP